MKWTTQVIIAFITLNSMIWAGITILPTTSPMYMNMSSNLSVPERVLGTYYNVDAEPGTEAWLQPDAAKINASITTEPSNILQIPASVLGGFLGNVGRAFNYVLGFLGNTALWFGGMWVLLDMIGMPPVWSAMISAVWVLLFLFTLISFLTGKDV